MFNFSKFLAENQNDFFSFLNLLNRNNRKLLIIGDLVDIYNRSENEEIKSNENLKEAILYFPEMVVLNNRVYIDVRVRIGYSEFYLVNVEEIFVQRISIQEYLIAKEEYVNPGETNDILTLNFKPFYDKYPSVKDVKSIGSGVQYLNKYLSSQMFNDAEKWKKVLLNFIKVHKHDNRQLLLNDRIKDPDHLINNLSEASKKLGQYSDSTPYNEVKHTLQDLGFEAGLGKDVAGIKKSFKLLEELLNSPDHISLAEFLSRIPMIFNIAIVSTHGYFAQENVLGMPDSGGQIVYILDQVKALEKSLINSLKESGVDVIPKIVILTRLIPNAGETKCNVRLEKVYNTRNSWILRVPFRKHNEKVTDNWISRFEIWPYLEEFAEDSYIELSAEFQGKPDLIIGNYSDGNLLSYLLSKKFGVTQCCIAHALEKSKYLFSDLSWKNLEDQYNFSLQFTADLIAMNSSDFQITSTYQEIAGTEYSVGQYETHRHFTLPDLYRVENGINLYDIKFNIISPGVNEGIYFPYSNNKKRIEGTKSKMQHLLFEEVGDPSIIGTLKNPDLIPIFSMARLDKNKNLTALVKWYGESPALQKISNLIIIAGKVNVSESSDTEEIDEIKTMWDYIDRYNLKDKIRWLGKLLRKDETGEVYRIIADRRGVFVQPGLFEGFGLTVLEGMISGLPVIATKYGGPLEIIQDGINGFHIDPINGEESKKILLDVIKRIKKDKNFWEEISKNSIKRVNESYNWRLYSQKLLNLSKIYGFWKYLTDLDRADINSYLEIIYHLLYKPRAEKLLQKHNSL